MDVEKDAKTEFEINTHKRVVELSEILFDETITYVAKNFTDIEYTPNMLNIFLNGYVNALFRLLELTANYTNDEVIINSTRHFITEFISFLEAQHIHNTRPKFMH